MREEVDGSRQDERPRAGSSLDSVLPDTFVVAVNAVVQK